MRTLFVSLLTFLCLSTSAQFVDLDWAHSLGANHWDNINVVVVDDSGNVYTEGVFRDTVDFDPGPGTYLLHPEPDSTDHFIQKLDAAGNLIWVRQFDTQRGVDSVAGELMVVDRKGNIYLSQPFTGTVDLDPGPGVFNLTATSGWGFDVFILKLDSDGNFIWAKQIGGPADDRVGSIAVDSSGNVYTSGNFYGPVDFDPGPGRFDMVATTIGDVFIQKLDSAGNLVWARQYGNANFESVHQIEISREQNLVVNGSFKGSVDFDPGSATFTLNSLNNTYDPYTLIDKGDCSEMSACVNVTNVGIDPAFQAEVNYYPNPSTGLLHIDMGRYYSWVEVVVVNVVGEKVVYEKRRSLEKFSFSLPHQKGMYFINIKVEGKNAILKVLKN